MKLKQEFLERISDEAIDHDLVDTWFSSVSTPLGRLLVVATPKGLCRIAFDSESEDHVLEQVAAGLGPRIVASKKGTETAASNCRRTSKVISDPSKLRWIFPWFERRSVAACFRQHVGSREGVSRPIRRWLHVLETPRPFGATGSALGRNPVPIIVPCHRVVPSSGGLGNYTGGVHIKEFLLRLEGAAEADRGGGAG